MPFLGCYRRINLPSGYTGSAKWQMKVRHLADFLAWHSGMLAAHYMLHATLIEEGTESAQMRKQEHSCQIGC